MTRLCLQVGKSCIHCKWLDRPGSASHISKEEEKHPTILEAILQRLYNNFNFVKFLLFLLLISPLILMLKNIVLLCITILNAQGTTFPDENYWKGRWFPHSPSEPDSNPVSTAKKTLLHHPNHGIVMGIRDARCDDAKTNLELDWFMNPENYTCFEDRNLYLPHANFHPVHSMVHIPSAYSAPHVCMNETIEYAENVPTFGAHRPLWAMYGEYTFLPKQRWIHNLEHGALVMLYHPCANKNEVNSLRKLVRSCLYKHVITPYNLLPKERPLVLVTWGHRLEMSKVSAEVVVGFIRQHAVKGPEATMKDGQYTLMLEKPAAVVSDINDSQLCPGYQSVHM